MRKPVWKKYRSSCGWSLTGCGGADGGGGVVSIVIRTSSTNVALRCIGRSLRLRRKMVAAPPFASVVTLTCTQSDLARFSADQITVDDQTSVAPVGSMPSSLPVSACGLPPQLSPSPDQLVIQAVSVIFPVPCGRFTFCQMPASYVA